MSATDPAAPDADPAPRPAIPHSRARAHAVAGAVTAAILVAGGAVVYPKWAARNHNANESTAIATLKNVYSAQAQCKYAATIDVDGDGVGEYGFFGELSGRFPVRGASRRVTPPVLSPAFGEIVAARVEWQGYVFQIFLPGRARQGVAEDPAGGDPRDDNGVAPDQAEQLWCCYAWPRDPGYSGSRVFFIDQGGDVLGTSFGVARYGGLDRPCPFWAAFAASASRALGADIAANTLGQDGNVWAVFS